MRLGRKWWLAAGVAVVVAVVVAGFVVSGGTRGPAQTAPTTSKVVRGTVVSTVSAAGTVQAQASRSLGFSSSGTVVEVGVKAGDVVAPGTVLAKIDPANAQKSVDQAQQAVSAAEDGVE